MSDPATTARTARESLARGLAALQSDPHIPPQLVELAQPIAQSMGALMNIERSNGTQLVPHANVALENVRHALQSLQAHANNHPAVNAAMEAVASSLGLVHALSKLAGGGAPAPQPQAAPPQQAYAQPPQQQPPQQHQGGFPQAQQQYQQRQQAATAPMAQTVAAPMGGIGQPMHQPPMHQPPMHQPPMQQPMAQPMPQQNAAAYAQTAVAAQPMGGNFARDPFASPGAPPPAAGAAGDKLVVPADLGAQSPTNFYKGLSGNDIVDHGGLFVSTYMIPKIGTPIRLKVSLPGGYEFEADATVRWARDVRDASSDAPPGFGAQFTGITNEARQLIYRYVRNREPLFHDDL